MVIFRTNKRTLKTNGKKLFAQIWCWKKMFVETCMFKKIFAEETFSYPPLQKNNGPSLKFLRHLASRNFSLTNIGKAGGGGNAQCPTPRGHPLKLLSMMLRISDKNSTHIGFWKHIYCLSSIPLTQLLHVLNLVAIFSLNCSLQ